jgi:hypothetical protein
VAAFSGHPKLEAAPDMFYLTHRALVECPGTLLITLYGNDANTPAQDRTQLGVAELVKGAIIVDRRVDYLHGCLRGDRRSC